MKKLTTRKRKKILKLSGIKETKNIKIRKYKTNSMIEEELTMIYDGAKDIPYALGCCGKQNFKNNKKLFASYIWGIEKRLSEKNSIEKMINKISLLISTNGITKTEIAFNPSSDILHIHDKPIYCFATLELQVLGIGYLSFDFSTEKEFGIDFQTKIAIVKPNPHDKIIYTAGEYTIKKAIKIFLKNLKTYFKYKFHISYEEYKEQLIGEEIKKLRDENKKLKEENKALKEINERLGVLRIKQFNKDMLKKRIKEAHFNGLFGDKGRITSYKELKNAFIKAIYQMSV